MPPTNPSPPQETVSSPPSPVALGSNGVSPPISQVPQQSVAVKPNSTNYAAAVFFTLLIVGFTFHLPSLLYAPMIFFCITAGIFFFRDTLAARKVPPPIAGQPSAQYDPNNVVKKKRNPLLTALLVIFSVIGGIILLYIGIIVFFLIMAGSSGF